jgi:IS30 family transposase
MENPIADIDDGGLKGSLQQLGEPVTIGWSRAPRFQLTPRLSINERVEILRLQKEVHSVCEISRRMGRSWWGVQWALRPPSTGGPKTWNPSPARLSMMDREEIRAGLSRGNTLTSIAGEIGRAVSTISREVANNGGRDAYRAVAFHERADRCARRPKGSKLGVFRHRCGEFR